MVVVHDRDPRTMSPKVHCFVPAQSPFKNVTRVRVTPEQGVATRLIHVQARAATTG
jgi:predicted DNA-binding protein (UPF0251 family)